MKRDFSTRMRGEMRTEEDLFVDAKYKILYEDEFFLAVDKSAPLPVHPVGRFKKKNLLSLLKEERSPDSGDFGIVNRLDSETSGIVLVSKSSAAAGQLGLLLEKRKIYKEYRAIVLGIPQETQGTISIPLGVQSERGHNIRVPDLQGQTARTDYQVMRCSGGNALLKVVPQTGRTHQIRAHLAFLGYPIAGDKIYIDPGIFERYIHEGWQEEMLLVVKSERLLLHASKLEFRHPASGKPIKLSADLPLCFDLFLN